MSPRPSWNSCLHFIIAPRRHVVMQEWTSRGEWKRMSNLLWVIFVDVLDLCPRVILPFTRWPGHKLSEDVNEGMPLEPIIDVPLKPLQRAMRVSQVIGFDYGHARGPQELAFVLGD